MALSEGSELTERLKACLNFRESALPRIASGAMLTTMGGFYTSTIVLDKALMDPYLANENVQRLRRVRHLYTSKAFMGSLLFFAGVELVHKYCLETNLYRNYFTDSLGAALLLYPAARHSLRRNWSEFRPSYL